MTHHLLPPVSSSARLARRLAAHDAVLGGLSQREAGDLVLVVSELVSNAIEASSQGDPVSLDIRQTEGAVLVVVRNRRHHDEADRVVPAARALPEAEVARGRGLAITGRLAPGIEVRRIGREVVAAATIRLARGTARAEPDDDRGGPR